MNNSEKSSFTPQNQDINLNGFYIAKVVNNQDPLNLERLQVQVLGVHDINSQGYIWAWRAGADANHAGGLPDNGQYVYVTFIQGDPTHCIWVGVVRSYNSQTGTSNISTSAQINNIISGQNSYASQNATTNNVVYKNQPTGGKGSCSSTPADLQKAISGLGNIDLSTLMLAQLAQESSFVNLTHSADGLSKGIAQFTIGTWNDVWRNYSRSQYPFLNNYSGIPDRMDIKANIYAQLAYWGRNLRTYNYDPIAALVAYNGMCFNYNKIKAQYGSIINGIMKGAVPMCCRDPKTGKLSESGPGAYLINIFNKVKQLGAFQKEQPQNFQIAQQIIQQNIHYITSNTTITLNESVIGSSFLPSLFNNISSNQSQTINNILSQSSSLLNNNQINLSSIQQEISSISNLTNSLNLSNISNSVQNFSNNLNINGLIKTAQGLISGLPQQLSSVTQSLNISNISNILSNIPSNIDNVFSNITNNIQNNLQNGLNLQNITGNLNVGSIKNTIQNIGSTIQNITGNLNIGNIGNILNSQSLSKLSSIISPTSLSGLTSSLSGITGNLGNTIQGLTGNLSGTLSGLTSSLSGITGNLGNTIQGLTGNLSGTLSGLTSSLSGITGNLGGSLSNITSGLTSNISSQIFNISGNLSGLVSGQLSNITGSLSSTISSQLSNLNLNSGLSNIISNNLSINGNNLGSLAPVGSPTPSTTGCQATVEAITEPPPPPVNGMYGSTIVYGDKNGNGLFLNCYQNNEDVSLTHISKSHYRIDKDGDVIIIATGDEIEIITKNRRISVTGDNINLYSGNNIVRVIKDNTISIEGNDCETVKGNSNININGNYTVNVQGNINITANGNLNIKNNGTANITSNGMMNIRGSLIKLN